MQERGTSETGKDHKHNVGKYVQGNTVDMTEILASTKIFTDAAWNKQEQSSVNGTGKAGIGIIIQGQEGQTKWQIKISATATSSISDTCRSLGDQVSSHHHKHDRNTGGCHSNR